MLDKNLVLLLHNNGHSYASISRTMSVSRQRIHQIVKGYKNIGRGNRKEKYKDFNKCSVCGDKAIHLHHKDRDNTNDEVKNLLAVCKRCHIRLHTNLFWSRRFLKCINCLSIDFPHVGKGLCGKCYHRCTYVSKIRYLWSRKYPFCQRCKSDKIKYDGHGLCHNCYIKERYHQRK